MEQTVALPPPVENPEIQPTTTKNTFAHVGSVIGIVGLVLLAGAIAVGVNALVIALTTLDLGLFVLQVGFG